MICSIFIICIQTIKFYPSTSVIIWMIVRHILNCGCEALSYLNMITALFVSAAAQKMFLNVSIWLWQRFNNHRRMDHCHLEIRQCVCLNRDHNLLSINRAVLVYTLYSIQIFLCFWKSLLCSSRPHLFDHKHSKNSNTMKYYYHLKCFLFNIF